MNNRLWRHALEIALERGRAAVGAARSWNNCMPNHKLEKNLIFHSHQPTTQNAELAIAKVELGKSECQLPKSNTVIDSLV